MGAKINKCAKEILHPVKIICTGINGKGFKLRGNLLWPRSLSNFRDYFQMPIAGKLGAYLTMFLDDNVYFTCLLKVLWRMQLYTITLN